MTNRWENNGNSEMADAALKLKDTCSLEEKLLQI